MTKWNCPEGFWWCGHHCIDGSVQGWCSARCKDDHHALMRSRNPHAKIGPLRKRPDGTIAGTNEGKSWT